ncbi:MAG: hypothetical protein LBG47_11000 [Prevotellaceae bacterium]|nr:hypothetical protein [Prevotellaceae bacterium]
MEKEDKKATAEKPQAKEASSAKKPKSAYTMFREKYPNGIGEIINMRAVLR